MIEINLKKCCKQCDYSHLKVSNITLQCVTEPDATILSKIYCLHRKVCKKYLECDEYWPERDQT